MNQEENRKNDFGYKLGYFLGDVIVVCVILVIIALTAKFIFWLF